MVHLTTIAELLQHYVFLQQAFTVKNAQNTITTHDGFSTGGCKNALSLLKHFAFFSKLIKRISTI